jgi:DNA primase
VRSDQFNTTTLPRRLLSLKEDPWAEIDNQRQGITAAAKRKVGMKG